MFAYDTACCFIIYAFLGWCIEVAYAAFKTGKFVNRGFLNGPVCPVYGFGAIIVIFLLTPLKQNFLFLFLCSVILTSVLEYITGFALNKIFCDKWWDYSDCKYNLQGYICLKFSLVWGAVCVVVVNVLHPFVIFAVHIVPNLLLHIAVIVLLGVLITDAVLTIIEAVKIKKYFKNIDAIEAKIRNISDTLGQEIAQSVLKAEKLKSEFNERKDSVMIAVKSRNENSQLKTELEALKAKFKKNHFKEGYVYTRLSNAYPLYFNKKHKNVSKIKRYFKNHK